MLKLTLLCGALALACSPALAQPTDPFASFSDTVTAPSRHGAAITPSDTADLASVPKAIYVGGGGDIAVIGVDAPANATGIIFKAVPAGTTLPFRARRVLATGTTATNLLALY